MTSAELRELLREATARPWSRSDVIEGVNVVGDGWVVAKCCCRRWDQAGNDARLIVALVNHAEAIAELIEAATLVVTSENNPDHPNNGCWQGEMCQDCTAVSMLGIDRLRSALARVKEGA